MDNVYNKSREAYPDKVAQDEYSFLWELKKDWYDLDFLYLKKHPEFKAFQIYQGLVGFHNCYMDIFAEDAFDNRREYITGFYLAGRENVEREYKYFTEQQAEKFVQESYKIILKQLQKYI